MNRVEISNYLRERVRVPQINEIQLAEKKKMLLDLDGVVYDFKPYYYDELSKVCHTQLGERVWVRKYDEYKFEDMMPFKNHRDMLYGEVYDRYIRDAEPIRYMSEVSKMLCNMYELHIVTARGTIMEGFCETPERAEKLQMWTLDSLQRNGIHYHKIAFESDKIKYINENGISYAVEDSQGTIKKIATMTDAEAIIFSQPYNIGYDEYAISREWSAYSLLGTMEMLYHMDNDADDNSWRYISTKNPVLPKEGVPCIVMVRTVNRDTDIENTSVLDYFVTYVGDGEWADLHGDTLGDEYTVTAWTYIPVNVH